MSSNIITMQILESSRGSLAAEFIDGLKSCLAGSKQLLDYPVLAKVFSSWPSAYIYSLAEYENGVELVLDCSSTEGWCKNILAELVEYGAGWISVEVYHDQVDDKECFYYRGCESISFGNFPKVKYVGVEQEVLKLVEREKDKDLVKKIKEGLNPNLVVDGLSLLELALRYDLTKTPYALLDAGANFKHAMIKGEPGEIFNCIIHRTCEKGRERLLQALVDAGFDVNARTCFDVLPLVQVAACVAKEEETSMALLDVLLRAGVDLNADVEEGLGSLLFNLSYFKGDYQQQVIDKLVAAGAQVVAGTNLSPRQKASRLLERELLSQTVAELAAEGFDFEECYFDREPFVLYVLQSDLKLFLEILDYVDFSGYMNSSPVRVLDRLYKRVLWASNRSEALAVAEVIIKRMLDAGFDPGMDALDENKDGSKSADYSYFARLPDRVRDEAGDFPPYKIKDIIGSFSKINLNPDLY